MYNFDELKEYIDNSETIRLNDSITVKFSNELKEIYDNGGFNDYLNMLTDCYREVKSLDIKIPNNKNPKLYVYIVPLDRSSELLKTPKAFDRGNGGGKPVTCFEEDGFVSAYGVSDNIATRKKDNFNIGTIANNVHEMAHIFQSMYFRGNPLGEGFAEMVTYYGLDYEDKYNEHTDFIKDLKEEDILTCSELLDECKNGMFGSKELIPNKICSFRQSYVSAYLLVRGIVETYEEKYGITKNESINKFLNTIYNSKANNWEDVMNTLADSIEMDRAEFLNSKELQNKARESIVDKNKKRL